ncbi:MAG: DsbA family protein [Candidatus Aenigmatarchaeota archaeon]
MVFCIVGLVIFGILGIFSAKYRRYFRESLHCMRRQLMLKACDTQFDQEMKSKISAKISKKSPSLARFIFRRFVLLSWILLIIMLVSVASLAYGFYNFVAYGNCNGPDSNDFCIYNALLGSVEDKTAAIKPLGPDGNPTIGSSDAPVKIVEVGCFSCPFTKKAETFRKQILDKYGSNVSFTFRIMPLPYHNFSSETAEAAYCALDQNRYWEYHDKLFEYQGNMSIQKLHDIAAELGMDTTKFDSCFDSNKYAEKVKKDYDAGVAAGIFATPTYFVNDRTFVGLKAFSDFENVVASEMEASCHV